MGDERTTKKSKKQNWLKQKWGWILESEVVFPVRKEREAETLKRTSPPEKD